MCWAKQAVGGGSMSAPSSTQAERFLAGGFVTDAQGRALVLQRSEGQFLPGYWELPSGHVEAGEAPEQAALREVKEETGLIVSVGPLVSQFSYQTRSGAKATQFDYLLPVVSGEVILSAEHHAYRWLKSEEEIPQPMSAESAGELRKFFGSKHKQRLE